MNRGLKPNVCILLGACLLFALISYGYGGTQDEKLPSMYIQNTNVDLGELYEGADIEYTFIVLNNGLEKLDIKVKPG
ncbi:MAG TPA: hypothetical protein VMX58_09430 [Patescibacteria group bacterium]|nr:hypothetical protein [Patescibacteria group bacterium]